jgi:hypothetical protein
LPPVPLSAARAKGCNTAQESEVPGPPVFGGWMKKGPPADRRRPPLL